MVIKQKDRSFAGDEIGVGAINPDILRKAIRPELCSYAGRLEILLEPILSMAMPKPVSKGSKTNTIAQFRPRGMANETVFLN